MKDIRTAWRQLMPDAYDIYDIEVMAGYVTDMLLKLDIVEDLDEAIEIDEMLYRFYKI